MKQQNDLLDASIEVADLKEGAVDEETKGVIEYSGSKPISEEGEVPADEDVKGDGGLDGAESGMKVDLQVRRRLLVGLDACDTYPVEVSVRDDKVLLSEEGVGVE